jgi:hypothetical protein
VNAFDTDAILATFAKEALSKNIPREGPLKPQISPLRSSPGFPVETVALIDLHAALFKESRTRGPREQREVGNPGTELRSR